MIDNENTAKCLFSACSAIAKGILPPEIAKLMSPSRLIALPKSNGDVHPIAVGDALRRLTAPAICVQKKEAFANYFTPIHHGVLVQNGTELVAHHIGLMLEVNQDWIVLKSDVRNAFNSISKCDMLNEVCKAFPNLFSHIQQMYGHSSSLVYLQGSSSIVIPSQEGVHQGDPLRLVLFCDNNYFILFYLKYKTTSLKSPCLHTWMMFSCWVVLTKCLQLSICSKNLFQPSIWSVSETKCEVFSPNVTHITGFDEIPVSHDGSIFVDIPVGTSSFMSTTCVKAAHSGDQLCDQLKN